MLWPERELRVVGASGYSPRAGENGNSYINECNFSFELTHAFFSYFLLLLRVYLLLVEMFIEPAKNQRRVGSAEPKAVR
jgi:hypothetical protein